MRDPPPEVVASWPKPNYVNPEFQGPRLAIVGITLLVISTIVVSLRIYVRLWMRRSASWDDWLMIAVMPFVIGTAIVTIVATKYGWGIHIWDNKREWLRPSRILSWTGQFLYIAIMTLLKTSILASYLRFFTTKTYRLMTYAMIAVVISWFIAYGVTLLFNCKPLSHYWDLQPDSKCIDEFGKLFSSSITNFVTDVLVLILPIPTLWSLRLPTREKIVLIVLMSFGLTACFASALKTHATYKSIIVTYDVTWEGYNVWLWSTVEINLAVISPSIPILRPFAQRYFPRLGFRSLYHSADRRPNHQHHHHHSDHADGKYPRAVYRHDTVEHISDHYERHDSIEVPELSSTPMALTRSQSENVWQAPSNWA